MTKRVLFLILGFGLITAGIAGITTSLVDQKNKTALMQVERIQEETRIGAADEQRKLEEKRQEIDRLVMRLQAERRRFEEERRTAEAPSSTRKAAIEHQKRATVELKATPPKDHLKGKVDEGRQKQAIHASKDRKSRKGSLPQSDTRQSLAARAPRPGTEAKDVEWLSRKAGLEAARLFGPVEYYVRDTHELVLAEPFDYGPASIRVRVRVWKNERLIKDSLLSFSEASLRNATLPRA